MSALPTFEHADALARDLPGAALLGADPAPVRLEDAAALLAEHYGLRGDLSPLTGERDANFLLKTMDGQRRMLKLSHPLETPLVADFQTQALLHLARHAPNLPVQRLVPARGGEPSLTVQLPGTTTPRVMRVFSYLEGQPMPQAPRSEAQSLNVARSLAALDSALAHLEHPAGNKDLPWDIQQAHRARSLLQAVTDPTRRTLALAALADFESETLPRLQALPRQPIHNDFNLYNLLVDPTQPERVAGILDLGDMVLAPRINDLAVAASYQLSDAGDALRALCSFVAAYHAVAPLSSAELTVLPAMVRARLAMVVAISGWRAARQPDNADYLLRNNAISWDRLHTMAGWTDAAVVAALHQACGLPLQTQGPQPMHSPTNDTTALQARRARLLGPAYRLFYEEPLHLVRGEGVWLHDTQGKRYLDAYNNVASVGHAHPHVVEAIARQARTLNTHTRYLHEGILDYAERLLSHMPPALGHAMFTCSGSEANDLALRIARAHTGAQGLIITRYAYHGVTAPLAEASPSLGALMRLGHTVRTVPAPQSVGQNPAEVGRRFAHGVREAIAELAAVGMRPAALLVDTVFSSDGVFTAPAGFLQEAVQAVREAGGLLIADEVQSGFGRTGEAFWGFERHGLVPDIVTLGKPMGNGHPVAGLAVQPGVLAAFAATCRYFNTFGGNPVSMAAASAVLDVIEREGLQANAQVVGTYLHGRLAALRQRHPQVGEVRGAGLFVGLPLVQPDAAGPPPGQLAARVVNALRQRGVLLSATGPAADTLKIRPPLVFQREHADLLADTLDEVLADPALHRPA